MNRTDIRPLRHNAVRAGFASLLLVMGPGTGCHDDDHTGADAAAHAGQHTEPTGHNHQASGHHDHGASGVDDAARPKELQLPLHLVEVLRDEMRMIENAMKSIGGHLVRGEMAQISTLGRKIHGSFVLTQKLSPKDMEALVAALPGHFIELDRSFHTKALHLAEKAEANESAEVLTIYGEMWGDCVACHGRYAAKHFEAPSK